MERGYWRLVEFLLFAKDPSAPTADSKILGARNRVPMHLAIIGKDAAGCVHHCLGVCIMVADCAIQFW
jgi:hypothetical protein